MASVLYQLVYSKNNTLIYFVIFQTKIYKNKCIPAKKSLQTSKNSLNHWRNRLLEYIISSFKLIFNIIIQNIVRKLKLIY